MYILLHWSFYGCPDPCLWNIFLMYEWFTSAYKLPPYNCSTFHNKFLKLYKKNMNFYTEENMMLYVYNNLSFNIAFVRYSVVILFGIWLINKQKNPLFSHSGEHYFSVKRHKPKQFTPWPVPNRNIVWGLFYLMRILK